MKTVPLSGPAPAAALRLVLALLALALLPLDAHAHQRLLRTEPAREAAVEAVPRELRLFFYEPVQVAFTQIELIGPDGLPAPVGELRRAADADNVLVVPVPGPWQAGEYAVRWSTASADGHPVRGEFAFSVPPDAQGLAPDPADEPDAVVSVPQPAPVQPPPPALPPGEPFSAESPAYVAVRWVVYLATVGVLGAVAFGVGVLGVARRRERVGADLVKHARRGAARLGLLFAAVLALAALARLYAQSLAMHGPASAADPLRVGALLTLTVWGWGWMLQVAGALLAVAGFALARRGAAAGWWVAGIGALALGVTPALSGHAAAIPGGWGAAAIAAHSLHVLAAGGWLGGLLMLLLAGMPAAVRLGEGRRGAGVAALVRAFSPLAMGFVSVLVLTGFFATFLHMGSPTALIGSRYGLLLLVKLGLFAVVLAAGAYHYLVAAEGLEADEAAPRFRRSAWFELAAGAAVLLVTAMLVATARPYDEREVEAVTVPAAPSPGVLDAAVRAAGHGAG